MKKSFILYTDSLPAIETLSDEHAGLLLKSLLRFVNSGETPSSLPSELRYPFASLRSQIERNTEKYERIVERRREAGRKGGLQRVINQANASKCLQKQANQADSDSVSDSVSDSDSDSDSVSEIPSTNVDSTLIKSSSLHSEDSIIKGTNVPTSSDDDAKLVLTPPNGDCESKKDYSYKVMKFWNNVMKSPVAIPTIAKMTPKRKTVVNARVKEFGINAVYQAISKASESSFLNGGGSKGFLADFDWVFRPNNFPKVLEGNYDDVKPVNMKGNGTNQQQSRERREADLRAKERLEFIATKYGDINGTS